MTSFTRQSLLAEVEKLAKTARRDPAVVFNSHITGLAVIRSLGRHGVPVIALDSDPLALGLESRFATATGPIPYPLDDEQAFRDALLDLGRRLGRRAVLFPGNDEWLLPVARLRDELEPYFLIPFSNFTTLEALLDKRKLYRTARDLNIPTPRTWFFDEQSPEAIAKEVNYPVILKPAFQREFSYRFGVKVFEARSRDEFLRLAAEAAGFGLVAQEIIPTGAGSFYSLGSYIAPDGRAKGVFVGRKLAQFPPGFGTGCLVDARWVGEVADRGIEVLRRFNYHGISEVEFLRDPRDGRFLLLDANTRTWKWIGLPIAAGIDLPWLAYQNALGVAAEELPEPQYADGLKWIYLHDYFKLAGSGNHDGHLEERDWLALLDRKGNSRMVEAVYDPDDPLPFVKQIRSLFADRKYFCAC